MNDERRPLAAQAAELEDHLVDLLGSAIDCVRDVRTNDRLGDAQIDLRDAEDEARRTGADIGTLLAIASVRLWLSEAKLKNANAETTLRMLRERMGAS